MERVEKNNELFHPEAQWWINLDIFDQKFKKREKMVENGEISGNLKLQHKRTSLGSVGIFVLGAFVFFLGIGERTMSSYIQVLSKIKSSIGLGVGLLLMLTGLIGILAAKSRLRLYVLMTLFRKLFNSRFDFLLEFR